MKIIAFTGMPCSGKSEAVRIAKDKGFPVIRMGDIIWEETKNQGLELNDKNVGEVANNMREKCGKDIWAQRTIERIRTLQKTETLIIDGIRNSEEIESFKKELGSDFIVVAIDAPNEVRRSRVLSRSRKDDSNNIKDIEERDKRELRWGLGDVIASADIVVSNAGSINKFRDRIRKILNEI